MHGTIKVRGDASALVRGPVAASNPEAEDLHRGRYLLAERLYVAEVGPLRLADVVIDNTVFSRPQIMQG
ncbi:hypothetical protein ABT061_08230 [Streptosporangium sp. NPDC002544]|uniref:hypothetical protein n=1 Tax=Streptosporangium sp. NPDC002544 TaxID=3154538 RepID=UPI00332F6609